MKNKVLFSITVLVIFEAIGVLLWWLFGNSMFVTTMGAAAGVLIVHQLYNASKQKGE